VSVAAHLNIRIHDYDERIRTFIPAYDQMLDAAARAAQEVAGPTPHVVDLGTGSGALAMRCLVLAPAARVTAVDADHEILTLARTRLAPFGNRAAVVRGSFLKRSLPPCDAFVASLALHHVRSATLKQQLYRRCFTALSENGLFVTADCFPSEDARLAASETRLWHEHMALAYSEDAIADYFKAWADEDLYFPLNTELRMLRDAGFATEVVWRHGPLAVIAARKPATLPPAPKE
jgi:ubiquinone/menaquinone biosynthesis C-methylase UbiE